MNLEVTQVRLEETVRRADAWAGSTAYTIGNRVKNGGNVYQCSTAGTSAASGGPTGTGSGITDGTAAWDYLGVEISGVAHLMYGPSGNPAPFLRRHEWTIAADFEVSGTVWTDSSITRQGLENALEAAGKTQVLAKPEHTGDSFV